MRIFQISLEFPKGCEFLGVPSKPEGCEANDKKSRILSTRQLKSQDAYLSPSEFTSWELPGLCAVHSRSSSLQMLHFALRSMRSSLQQLHRRQLLKLFVLCSDFWPSTPMQLWFKLFSGILYAQILRLDDLFPSDHLDSAERISSSVWSSLSEIRRSKRPKKVLLEEYSFIIFISRTCVQSKHISRTASIPMNSENWIIASLTGT